MSIDQAQPRIFLSLPHMSGDEIEYVKEAFASNWIAPLGPMVDGFEADMSDYLGGTHALAVSSGTAAIHLALKLCGIQPGDRVLCSSLTFSASANPIIYEQGIPVFIDSEPDSWNMSPVALKKALIELSEQGTPPRAAVIVNIYGQSADYEPLIKLCREYGVRVIEDAAESLGARYHESASGTMGDFGVLSFNGNKIITTAGGGMLLSRDREALAKAKFWSTQARDNAPWYEHSELGYNYRMSNILAAIGRAQLKSIDQRVEQRRQIHDYYVQRLAAPPGIDFMPTAAFGRPNNWLTVMTLNPQFYSPGVVDIVREMEKHNIETRPVWKPMHMQPFFADCVYYTHYDVESCCDGLFARGLCLPSGTGMSPEDLERVCTCLEQVLKSGLR